ncbi:MAG: UDP-3-O-(3-hydroxymyristoyl)glucosamine N-acyltransferase [Chlamydiales bacterium]|nr:UDP-3-O-(3-hydroxymyristoyl)glucosamine N-acyltransferase [Chlamydiia bacterium]MCP5507317.1 UDP-3-O-(3-hydroxymyristoyl)glucosamine N-acyltransferase [Chlamydiales bacterium]
MTETLSYTADELAEMTESELVGNGTIVITDIADLESAESTDASFFANPLYENAMKQSRAGVIFIAPHLPQVVGKNYLIHKDPSRAFQIVIEAFRGKDTNKSALHGIHPSAFIHDTVKLGDQVTVGPYAVIEEGATIGNRTFIGPNSYIGPGSSIGEDCYIHPNVTIRERCQIGNRVIIQSSSVIGSCGFGYTTNEQGKHVKLNQVGIIILEDDVEIGSCTTVDRGRFKATRICAGTKIGNQTQISHGCKIGNNNLIVGQSGIAGSSETGNNVILAGQVGITGHIKVADGVILAANAATAKSIRKPGIYSGRPAIPIHEFNKQAVFLRNLPKLAEKLKQIEKELETVKSERA